MTDMTTDPSSHLLPDISDDDHISSSSSSSSLYSAIEAAAPCIVPDYVHEDDAKIVVLVLVKAGLLDLDCGGSTFISRSPQVFERLTQIEVDKRTGHITSLLLGFGGFGVWTLPSEIQHLPFLQCLTITGRCVSVAGGLTSIPQLTTIRIEHCTISQSALEQFPLLPQVSHVVLHCDKIPPHQIFSWITTKINITMTLKSLDLRFRRRQSHLETFLNILKQSNNVSFDVLEELSVPNSKLTEGGLESLLFRDQDDHDNYNSNCRFPRLKTVNVPQNNIRSMVSFCRRVHQSLFEQEKIAGLIGHESSSSWFFSNLQTINLSDNQVVHKILSFKDGSRTSHLNNNMSIDNDIDNNDDTAHNNNNDNHHHHRRRSESTSSSSSIETFVEEVDAFVSLLQVCPKLSNLGTHLPRDILFRPSNWHDSITALLRYNQFTTTCRMNSDFTTSITTTTSKLRILPGVHGCSNGDYGDDDGDSTATAATTNEVPLSLWPSILHRVSNLPPPPGCKTTATGLNFLLRHGPPDLTLRQGGMTNSIDGNHRNIETQGLDEDVPMEE